MADTPYKWQPDRTLWQQVSGYFTIFGGRYSVMTALKNIAEIIVNHIGLPEIESQDKASMD